MAQSAEGRIQSALKLGLQIAGAILVVAALGGAYRVHRAYQVIYPHGPYDMVPPQLPAGLHAPAILVFSKTNGYRHEDAIPAANAALREIARQRGWSIYFTENGAVFNPADLSRFQATVWNNTSGDVLNDAQKQAFRTYIESGGGFVGIHGAGGDPRYAWRWYVETLIAAQFKGHTLFPHFPTATIHIEQPNDPATKDLPTNWVRSDEWYSFKQSPRAKGVEVLATLDERSYKPRMAGVNIAMGSDHPIIWKHCVGKGRAFYSAIGHSAGAYQEPLHLKVLAGAIAWAAGLEGENCGK